MPRAPRAAVLVVALGAASPTSGADEPVSSGSTGPAAGSTPEVKGL